MAIVIQLELIGVYVMLMECRCRRKIEKAKPKLLRQPGHAKKLHEPYQDDRKIIMQQ